MPHGVIGNTADFGSAITSSSLVEVTLCSRNENMINIWIVTGCETSYYFFCINKRDSKKNIADLYKRDTTIKVFYIIF